MQDFVHPQYDHSLPGLKGFLQACLARGQRIVLDERQLTQMVKLGFSTVYQAAVSRVRTVLPSLIAAVGGVSKCSADLGHAWWVVTVLIHLLTVSEVKIHQEQKPGRLGASEKPLSCS